MDKAIDLIYDSACAQVRKTLSGDPRYRRYTEERQALWEALRQRYPHETVLDVLRFTDAEGAVADSEKKAFFLLGLQLGVSLGRIDLLLP